MERRIIYKRVLLLKTPLRLISRALNFVKTKLFYGLREPKISVSVGDVASTPVSNHLVLVFDGAWYLERNPDVVAANLEPFEHFIRSGWGEGRVPTPYFDEEWYIQRYGELIPASIGPFEHFIRHGIAAGLDPHPLFSSR